MQRKFMLIRPPEMKFLSVLTSEILGGASRARTDDLIVANDAVIHVASLLIQTITCCSAANHGKLLRRK